MRAANSILFVPHVIKLTVQTLTIALLTPRPINHEPV